MTRCHSRTLIATLALLARAPGAAEDGPVSRLIESMVSVNGCEIIPQDDYVLVAGPTKDRSLIQTKKRFRPPFVVRLVAKTDSTNLRLYYNAGMVILNWEVQKTQLRVHDPVTDEPRGVRGRGYVSPHEWHDIIWEVRPDGMRLVIDDGERFHAVGDYADLDAPVGIGPAFGSVLSLGSLDVVPLKGKEQVERSSRRPVPEGRR